MKVVIAFAAFTAVAAALSSSPRAATTIVRSNNDNIGIGARQLSSGTSDETKASGQVIEAGFEDNAIIGTVQWTNPMDGQTYTVNYIADENIFEPEATHLPESP